VPPVSLAIWLLIGSLICAAMWLLALAGRGTGGAGEGQPDPGPRYAPLTVPRPTLPLAGCAPAEPDTVPITVATASTPSGPAAVVAPVAPLAAESPVRVPSEVPGRRAGRDKRNAAVPARFGREPGSRALAGQPRIGQRSAAHI
jgi:hypothetical protein